MALVVVAACAVLLRPARAEGAGALRLVALVLLGCLAAVVLLPAEALYYYLDTTLVPGAVVIGAAWQMPRARTLGRALLVAFVAARALVLLWWVEAAATSGFVAANLDFLRLGGERPSSPGARARLPSVATKSEVARILAEDLAIPIERLWRDVHGSGFSDVDTDNGFFLRRAAGDARAGGRSDRGMSALVSFRGDFPEGWLARLGPPRAAGPLEVRGYRAAIDGRGATLVGCGGGPAPAMDPPEPLAYGSGEPVLPRWPCAEPEVAVPVGAPPSGAVLRVFARVDGAARILDVRSEPSGTPLASAAAGAGTGLELPPGPARLLVRLAASGPARLDLVELHGVR
jgi:hypothetical protein